MQTLVPRAAYDRDELGVNTRITLFATVFFGLCMMGMILYMDRGDESALGAFGKATLIGSASGCLFGILLVSLLKVSARRLQDRLYAGDASLVQTPSPDQYSYRLPCGWMYSPRQVVSGILYLGARGLRFDAHLNTPAQLRQSIVLEPVEALTLTQVDTPVPVLARIILGHRTLPRVEIRSGVHSAQFSVPDTAATAEQLRDRLNEL